MNRAIANGSHSLTLAAYAGRLDLVKLLVSHNADVNLANKWGCTPLFYAAQRGHQSMVGYLLKNGADPSKKWAMVKIGQFALITRSPLEAARYSAKNMAIVQMIKSAIKQRRVKAVCSSMHPASGPATTYGAIQYS